MRSIILKSKYWKFDTVSLRGVNWRCLIFLTILTLLSALCSEISVAQWKFLKKDGFHVIHFLDHVGLPNTGFLGGGLNEKILKTTDGGLTWRSVLADHPPVFLGINEITDFAFKDGQTGWCSVDGWGQFPGCYKTTNGGDTWFALVGSESTCKGIWYDQQNGGLFLTTSGGNAALGQDLRSWDEGATWSRFGDVGIEQSGGFAFSDGDVGLMSWYDHPADGSWWQTKDGGHTWSSILFDSMCYQPLAIPGTQTYFANTVWGVIMRTDDAGATWKHLFSFGPQYRLDGGEDVSTSSGCIRGTLDSLFVMMCSGCYLSTDQGLSWKFLCGQPNLYFPYQRFYLNGRRLYIFSIDSTRFSSLWMMDLDSMQYFDSKVESRFSDGSKRIGVSAGSDVSVNILPTPDQSVGIDSVHIVSRFDSESLRMKALKIPVGWSILDSSTRPGLLNLWLTSTTTDPLPTPIVQLTFGTLLASASAKVYLDSANLYGKHLNCDCQALSIPARDSVQIDFNGCADSIILSAMQHKAPFDIVSVLPNPASHTITISLSEMTAARYQLFDPLGVLKKSYERNSSESTLDVSDLPNGVYYLRVSQSGFVQSRKVVISR
jgi:photosystem II stability/assembly factor-like uncharacterized protein